MHRPSGQLSSQEFENHSLLFVTFSERGVGEEDYADVAREGHPAGECVAPAAIVPVVIACPIWPLESPHTELGVQTEEKLRSP